MPDRELIELPSGTKLYYRDSDHSYWKWNPKTNKPGRRATGVTTACKALDTDPSNLMRWAAKQQLIGAAKLVEALGEEQAVKLLADPDGCWAELEARAWTYNDVRDKAASEGTNVHRQAFEALAKGDPMPDLTGLGEREVGLAQAVHRFWFDHHPTADHVEQVVFSEKLGVAGRVDFLGNIGHCDNETCGCHDLHLLYTGVLDLKTGGYLGASAHAQVGGGYPKLAAESGFPEPGWAAMLQVRDDGTYEIVRAESSPEEFELAVLAYRAAGRINGAAGKARRERRKAREAVETGAVAV